MRTIINDFAPNPSDSIQAMINGLKKYSRTTKFLRERTFFYLPRYTLEQLANYTFSRTERKSYQAMADAIGLENCIEIEHFRCCIQEFQEFGYAPSFLLDFYKIDKLVVNQLIEEGVFDKLPEFADYAFDKWRVIISAYEKLNIELKLKGL